METMALDLYKEDLFIFLFQIVCKNLYKKTDILHSLYSNHLPIFFVYKNRLSFDLGENFWKFNSTLTHDEAYMSQIKEYINLIGN